MKIGRVGYHKCVKWRCCSKMILRKGVSLVSSAGYKTKRVEIKIKVRLFKCVVLNSQPRLSRSHIHLDNLKTVRLSTNASYGILLPNNSSIRLRIVN